MDRIPDFDLVCRKALVAPAVHPDVGGLRTDLLAPLAEVMPDNSHLAKDMPEGFLYALRLCRPIDPIHRLGEQRCHFLEAAPRAVESCLHHGPVLLDSGGRMHAVHLRSKLAVIRKRATACS